MSDFLTSDNPSYRSQSSLLFAHRLKSPRKLRPRPVGPRRAAPAIQLAAGRSGSVILLKSFMNFAKGAETSLFTNTVQFGRDSYPIGAEPLLRPLGIWAKALDCKPELCRVIRNSQMNCLVDDQVAEYEIGCED